MKHSNVLRLEAHQRLCSAHSSPALSTLWLLLPHQHPPALQLRELPSHQHPGTTSFPCKCSVRAVLVQKTTCMRTLQCLQESSAQSCRVTSNSLQYVPPATLQIPLAAEICFISHKHLHSQPSLTLSGWFLCQVPPCWLPQAQADGSAPAPTCWAHPS